MISLGELRRKLNSLGINLRIENIERFTGQYENAVTIPGRAQRYIMNDFHSSLLSVGLISDRAYFVYLGKTTKVFTPTFVEFLVTTIGAGTQTAEVGFFSTPNPPNKGVLVFTKLVATGTVDNLTTTGLKRNTTAFATSIPTGTHLWAGIRTAMAITQPSITGLTGEYGTGAYQLTDSAGALTGTGPWTGVLFPVDTTIRCPDLRGVLD